MFFLTASKKNCKKRLKILRSKILRLAEKHWLFEHRDVTDFLQLASYKDAENNGLKSGL